MTAEVEGTRILGMVAPLDFTRPQPPGCAELGDLFEEIIVYVEEEGQLRRKCIYIESRTLRPPPHR